MRNTFGNTFKLTLWGSSHEPHLGVNIEGTPAGLTFSPEEFLVDLGRRKAGAKGTTPRVEDDTPFFLSGVRFEEGCDAPHAKEGYIVTTGEEIVIAFENKNIRSEDYERFSSWPRPGHADFVSLRKYGEVSAGGGIFSGRMTLPLVAAGVVAKKIIAPIVVSASLVEVGGISCDRDEVEKALTEAAADGDSLGGVIECRCSNMSIGLGEPFFDSIESVVSHAIFSIPGIRGIEFGDGFAAARMRGSQHNDCFVDGDGHTATNGCGGINGGISNGNPLVFRVAVKPTSSIKKGQLSFDFSAGAMVHENIAGRHDVCFALRVPPVVEAMTACVLADYIVQSKSE